MKKTEICCKPFTKFERLSLSHRALFASVIGWVLALCVSVIYCVYYTRYVNLEPRGLLESIVWFFQEYGIWLVLTPLLLMRLSHFGHQRRFGWFWLLVALCFIVSISFRLALDFYLNPDAQFVKSLVYFMPDHLFITLIVVMGWALVFRQLDDQKSSHAEIAINPITGLTEAEQLLETLEAYKGNRKVVVSIKAIQIATAAGNYVELQCADSQYLLRSTMKELEEQLQPYHFIRVHRSHLVNPAAIVSVQADSLTLNTGAKLAVSQRYRKNLKNFQ